jgi:hypothetical protein
MPFSTQELKRRLAIDKLALDDAVIEQPTIFSDVSDQLAEAIAERDSAKEELTVIDAQLDTSWRRKLSGVGTRVTDRLIASHVATSPEHAKAFDIYLKTKTKADKLTGLKESFKQRSDALRSLASLYAANYFEVSSLKPLQNDSRYVANRARISDARQQRNTEEILGKSDAKERRATRLQLQKAQQGKPERTG